MNGVGSWGVGSGLSCDEVSVVGGVGDGVTDGFALAFEGACPLECAFFIDLEYEELGWALRTGFDPSGEGVEVIAGSTCEECAVCEGVASRDYCPE